MIIKSNKNVYKNYFGEDGISKVYAGENLVFGQDSSDPVQVKNYMALKNVGQNNAVIGGKYFSDDSSMTGMTDIYYSSDATTWSLWLHDTPANLSANYNNITLQPGEKVYFKATGLGVDSFKLTNYFQFIISGDYDIEGSGDINSLAYGDNFENQTQIPGRAFFRTFEYCEGLTKAPDILAYEAISKAFYNCFKGCTKLSYVKCLVEQTYATGQDFPFYGWLNNVSQTGTFVRSISAGWQDGDVIPSGWTIIRE